MDDAVWVRSSCERVKTEDKRERASVSLPGTWVVVVVVVGVVRVLNP